MLNSCLSSLGWFTPMILCLGSCRDREKEFSPRQQMAVSTIWISCVYLLCACMSDDRLGSSDEGYTDIGSWLHTGITAFNESNRAACESGHWYQFGIPARLILV